MEIFTGSAIGEEQIWGCLPSSRRDKGLHPNQRMLWGAWGAHLWSKASPGWALKFEAGRSCSLLWQHRRCVFHFFFPSPTAIGAAAGSARTAAGSGQPQSSCTGLDMGPSPSCLSHPGCGSPRGWVSFRQHIRDGKYHPTALSLLPSPKGTELWGLPAAS